MGWKRVGLLERREVSESGNGCGYAEGIRFNQDRGFGFSGFLESALYVDMQFPFAYGSLMTRQSDK
ncbi:MAG: hypothetical protein B5M55_03100 [Desulfococcus sp. 4484_242]|nr:MAG: hypothetical protein B5M55_03100 [Desulfococcus sp. 4484_242]